MSKSVKVCTCILTGLVCLFSSILKAESIYTSPSAELFDNIHIETDKYKFVEEATYFTLNEEVLATILQQENETMTLQIPFGATKKLDVNLKKTDFFTEDFKVTVQSKDKHNTLSYSPSLYYRGAVLGVKDAMIILSFNKESIAGVLSLNGENYNIGKYGKDDSDTFVLYKEKNINASNPFSCSTEDPKELIISRINQTGARSNNAVSVYVECDYELFKANGSSAQATTDFATGLFNVIAGIYDIDDIKVELSEVKIWATEDPYPTNSAKSARDAFGASLNGNFNGDIAHLLSNYKVNGVVPNGGSANIDVLCNKEKAVGYTNITTTYKQYPTFSWTAYAVTHEIGHNLGSPHTHSCLWPTGPIDNCWCPEGDCDQGAEPASTGGTVMSYCHLNPQWTNDCDLSASNPGINLAGGFGALPSALIRSRIDDASCLNEQQQPTEVLRFQASSNIKNASCNQENGKVTLTVSYGQTPYQYKWNNGKKTRDLNNVAAGNYRCTITDAAGNTTQVTAKVNGTEPFFVSAGPDQIIGCSEPIVTLDGRDSKNGYSYDYKWSSLTGPLYGNVRKETMSISEPGIYVLTVSNDDIGCTIKDTVEVTEDFTSPALSLSVNASACGNDHTTIITNGSSNIVTYQWEGPNGFRSKEPRPVVTEKGLYTVVATGTNGCTIEKNIEISGNASPPSVFVEDGIISCGNTTTQLMATTAAEVIYDWRGPNNFKSTLQQPVVELPGTYHLKVTTAEGCTKETSVIVTQDSAPEVTAKGSVLDCHQSTATFVVTTDETDLVYNWNGPNGFTSTERTPIVSTAGVYRLDVRKANGCSTILDVEIEEKITPPYIAIQGENLTCSKNKVTLKGLSNDNILGYKWESSNGFISTKQTIDVLEAGNYKLTAINENGCASTKEFTVVAHTEVPTIELKANDLTCANPTSTLKLTTPDNNLAINWTGPEDFSSTEQSPITDLPGTYQVRVTNANGCSNTASVTVSQTLAPEIKFAGTTAISCNQEVVTIDASPSNFKERIDVEWTTTNGNIIHQINELMISVNEPGEYTLTARDLETACVTIETIKIDAAPAIAARIDNNKLLTCSNPALMLTADVNIDTENTIYSWETQNGNIISNRAAREIRVDAPGDYTLVVMDTITGCSAVTATSVSEKERPKAIIATPEMLTCNKLTTTLSGIGSTIDENSKIEWSRNDVLIPNSNAVFLTVNAEGTYKMMIKDTVTQCQTIAEMEVLKQAAPQVSVVSLENDACAKGEGSITLAVATENAYEVKWNTGQTGPSIDGLTKGDYTATVTDDAGCQVVVSSSIHAVTPISLEDIIATPMTCHDTENAKIEVALKGGNFPYEGQWSNGETGFVATNLGEGTHSLEVVDAKGCVSTFDFPVSAPSELQAEVTVLQDDAVVEVSGGAPSYQFLWDDATTERYGLNFSNGNHEVTIEDANGCSITKSFEIEMIASFGDLVGHDLEIQAFPNPTTDYFKVKIDLEEASAIDLSVFSASGKQMVRSASNVENYKIDATIITTDWMPGSYFLRVQTEEGVSVKKIEVVKL